MIELVPIDAKHIDAAWRMGAHNLSKACDTSDGDITGDQLKMMLGQGERQLLAMVRDKQTVGWAAIYTAQWPNKRVCVITGLYAPHARFADFLDLLWMWASADGCSELRCEALEGQARLYERAGFERVRTVMRYRK